MLYKEILSLAHYLFLKNMSATKLHSNAVNTGFRPLVHS